MNLLLSAKKDEFWFEFYDRICLTKDLNLVYWVGTRFTNRPLVDCFDHDSWDAFSLNGKCKDIKENNLLNLDLISREEYYNYLKILDRVDSSNHFSFSERDQLFKRQLTYWISVIEEKSIDFVVFSNAPHMPYDYPLYLAAKIKSIKTLMWYVTPVRGWHYLKEEINSDEAIDLKEYSVSESDFHKNAIDKFSFKNSSELWYMNLQKKSDTGLKSIVNRNSLFFTLRIFVLKLKDFIISKGKNSNLRVSGKYASIKSKEGEYSSNEINLFDLFRLKYSSNKKRNKILEEYQRFSRKIDVDKLGPYIYFPLHYQPEQTTAPLGGDFSDQVFLIQEIVKVLPSHITLVVKEHSSQFSSTLHGDQGRYLGYWKYINSLPNVITADLSEKSESLIKNSIGVVTVTGTAGWEALINGIRCFVFGHSWYSRMPNVTKVSSENLKNIFSNIDSEDRLWDSNDNEFDKITENAKYFVDLDIHNLASVDIKKRSKKNSEILIKTIMTLSK